MKKKHLFFAALFAALSLGFVSCENPDDDKFGNSIEQSDDDKFGNSTKPSDDNETPGAPDSGDDDSDTPSAGIGTFSVAADKKVTFSPGNLQYTQSTDTWSFAENQWDYIGTDNVTGGSVSSNEGGDYKSDGTALADKIDLFGWSTSATNFGVSIFEDYNDYSGSFVDWGSNQIGADAPNTWRTLTYEEWCYVVINRPNASSLMGVAQVNGVNGLILLPDSWTCPDGITFKSGFHDEYGVEDYAVYQTFTADQWQQMEAAGAVFLPAAGLLAEPEGVVVCYVRFYGVYWSATEANGYFARYLIFYSGEAIMDGNDNYLGRSVRLVKDL